MHELISGKDWKQMPYFQGDMLWLYYFEYKIHL